MWQPLLIGGIATTASATFFSYYYFRKTYPKFASLPGPFKQIGVSYHRIPNNARFKMYYPTSLKHIQESNSANPTTYFSDFDCVKSIWGIPSFLLKMLNDLKHSSNPMPCFIGAPIHKHTKSKYPVLLFSHGLAANFDTYTQLLCGLASYGIIVGIIEHDDGSAIFTKTHDNKHMYLEPGHLLNAQSGAKYRPNPWKTEHDIADYGEQRLKKVRVPQFIALYKYLMSNGVHMKDDTVLNSILDKADLKNLIFGGQSFGGVTSWMASHEMQDDALKCLLLFDPWFGCLDSEELKEMRWNIPGYVLSSEAWIKKKKYFTELTRLVMSNGLSKDNTWEYAKGFTHYCTSDVPLFGPSWLTGCRKIYGAQTWSDLVCKRSAAWIAQNIPSLKQTLNDESCLKYDKECVETIQAKQS
eukprot:199391_1